MRYVKPTVVTTTNASSTIQSTEKGSSMPDNFGAEPDHTPASAYEADE